MNSYSDNMCTVKYLDLDKLHEPYEVLDLKYKRDSFQGSTLFDISDIEAGVNYCLKNGKTCGCDGLSLI